MHKCTVSRAIASFSDFGESRKLEMTGQCLVIQFGLVSDSYQVVVAPSLDGGMTDIELGSGAKHFVSGEFLH